MEKKITAAVRRITAAVWAMGEARGDARSWQGERQGHAGLVHEGDGRSGEGDKLLGMFGE